MARRMTQSGTRAGRSSPFANVPVFVVALVLTAIVLVPIVFVVLGGFRTTGQIAADPVGLPDPWVSDNYSSVISSGTFWRQLGNSLIVAAIATALVVGVSAFAARTRSRACSSGDARRSTPSSPSGCSSAVAVAALPLYLLSSSSACS